MRFFSNIFRDPGLKIVALVLAILLWFHVATNHNYELTLDYTLEYVNLPDSLTLEMPPPVSIGVKMRAGGKQLLRLWWRSERPWPIDLSDATVGEYAVTLDGDNVPRYNIENVEVMDILQRGTWALRIDSVGTRRVAVFTTERFPAAEEFIPIGPITLSPDSIDMRGPRSLISSLDSLSLEVIGRTSWNETVDELVAVEVPNFYNVSLEPESIRVMRPIEHFVTKEYDSLPISVVQPEGPDSFAVDPAHVSVAVGGPESWMAHLESDSVRVVYAAGKDDTTGVRAPLWINISPPFEVLEVTPDSITVRRNGESDPGN